MKPRQAEINKKERATMWEVIGEFICGWGGTILACAGVLFLGVLAWIGAGQIGGGSDEETEKVDAG